MVPRWLELFVKPWTWLQETPLEPLMSAYAAWSYEQTLKSILPPPPPAKTVELTE
jgi:hypothetical protein